MLLYLRLVKESFAFAVNALRNNKLRTFLSLLGVTIGIFSIIAVLAAVDSLDLKIKKELSSLDKNTIYLFNDTFGPSEIPAWKREQFPNVTYAEFEYLRDNLPDSEEMSYQIFLKWENMKYESKTMTNVNIVPVTHTFINIQGYEFTEGRFFNESESNSGAAVVVIGAELAEGLFGELDPIGKQVRLYGQRFTVVGVLKKKGDGMFGNDDTSAIIPVNFIRRAIGENKSQTPIIVIKPKKGIDMQAFKADLSQKLRNYRGMKVAEADNFFINVFSGFTDLIDGIIHTMNIGGWIIAGFSLLVGGFGVANIMFVSVKERTNLIGIQKSLGAKNRMILFQFLFEAIILCLFGGLVGILFVWLLTLLLTSMLDFEFILSFSNIVLGSVLAIAIGIVSGILPAITASKLDPVEAIRSGL
ncbi:ABC transporter permease [Flavobacterium sp.]|uniref:ABC transporter permease n=1 Tax=Flavobacterium sp. TaxID=239 RepID=UPI0026087407|nr:ABC transporter permease [Flavobacterium sp.]